MKNLIHLFSCLLIVLQVFLLMGCGMNEQNTSNTRQPNPATHGKHIPENNNGPQDALRLVQESIEEESGLTTTIWVEQQLQAEEGQIMFPKWEARRQNMHEYEVKFTYTKLNDDYAIEKRGYTWAVNYILRLVSKPRPMSQSDFKQQPGHKPILQRNTISGKRTVDLE